MSLWPRLGSVLLTFLLTLLTPPQIRCAGTTPELGIRDKTPSLTAIVGARLVVSPGRTIEGGTLLIRDGVIIEVGENIAVPEGANILDLEGRWIYPGFVDPYTDYGLGGSDDTGGRHRWGRAPKYIANRVGGSAWNEAIHAEREWVDEFRPDTAEASQYHEKGYTTVQTARLDGILRGRAAVVLTGDGLPNDNILRPYALQFASFSKGSSSQDYPSSLMGAIALLRQIYLDIDWYEQARAAWTANPSQTMPEFNAAIEALAATRNQPVMFFTDDEQDLLRADRLAREFNLDFYHIGSNREYTALDRVVTTAAPLVLPLDFPSTPEVATLEDELDVTLATLRHWETAPSNPARLDSAGVRFAFTSHGIKSSSEFFRNLRLAVERGLSPRTALAALTTVPAELCEVAAYAGTLDRGKLANLIITDGDILKSGSSILAVWVKGEKHELSPLKRADFRGEFALHAPLSGTLSLTGTVPSPEGSFRTDGDTLAVASISVETDKIHFQIDTELIEPPGLIRFSARQYGDTLRGVALLPSGEQVDWSGVLTSPYEPEQTEPDEPVPEQITLLAQLTTPNKAYGFEAMPPRQDVLIRNATIWTSEEDGVLTGADLLVKDGKFAAIGTDLEATDGITVIDATGKHLTPGIIDEHSHIAIEGDVNEGTHSITSETRIEDVIDPGDINIYRQLSGGVTMVRNLHGSANPIGAEAAVLKLHWGSGADDLIYQPAPRGIKFALGENVKQSNWGDQFRIRYPQTRLGVEAIMRDALLAAREYEQQWEDWNGLSNGEKQRTVRPRRDLQLEALVRVLNRESLVTCHSYQQSGILMLIRLAEDFGFRVGVFTHILEGYKVADEIARHGAGAGSFSDWWAYKFEVYDAIPQSPALMFRKGVVTSINSDNAEMARRLNQEAAKSVMYADLPPTDALKMVTINPAIQLGVERYTGSIKVGKDADFVLWNDLPLSIYARVDQTWIEGRKYFDREADSLTREEVRREKYALIQKALKSSTDNAGNRRGGKADYHPPDLDIIDGGDDLSQTRTETAGGLDHVR